MQSILRANVLFGRCLDRLGSNGMGYHTTDCLLTISMGRESGTLAYTRPLHAYRSEKRSGCGENDPSAWGYEEARQTDKRTEPERDGFPSGGDIRIRKQQFNFTCKYYV